MPRDLFSTGDALLRRIGWVNDHSFFRFIIRDEVGIIVARTLP